MSAVEGIAGSVSALHTSVEMMCAVGVCSSL
jgi:hypothetical protein